MPIQKRNKTFHLVRRVPKRFSNVEQRSVVTISLHTDSEAKALHKAEAIWERYVEAWEAKRAGDSEDAELRFDAARELADRRGFGFLSAEKVARLPLQEIVARARVAIPENREPDKIEAAAVLGGAREPEITIERALEFFWSLAKDRIIGKSSDQVRRWKTPRIKAVSNFVSIIGNKKISEITADDMLEFRDWWLERMSSENMAANTANKDLIFVSDILKTINVKKRLKLDLPIGGLTIKHSRKNKRIRPPFSNDWIRLKLLAPGALDGLNIEARCILLGMINTGYRPSEAAGLLPQHIILDHDVPHITIKPVGRVLKTQESERIIPLVGISLEAFKLCPNGFPRYRESSITLSGTINKFLSENQLLETPDHVMYSLRHSFEDRMLAAKIDERIRCDFLGHRLSRERYGDGASLEFGQTLLQSIAL